MTIKLFFFLRLPIGGDARGRLPWRVMTPLGPWCFKLNSCCHHSPGIRIWTEVLEVHCLLHCWARPVCCSVHVAKTTTSSSEIILRAATLRGARRVYKAENLPQLRVASRQQAEVSLNTELPVLSSWYRHKILSFHVSLNK